jgi:hypothetical protein
VHLTRFLYMSPTLLYITLPRLTSYSEEFDFYHGLDTSKFTSEPKELECGRMVLGM